MKTLGWLIVGIGMPSVAVVTVAQTDWSFRWYLVGAVIAVANGLGRLQGAKL